MMNTPFDMKATFPQRVVIIGAARSGCAAARYFIKRDIAVFISDRCNHDKLKKILTENNLDGILYEAGQHTDRVWETDLIVLSPGVPSDLPVLQEAALNARQLLTHDHAA